MKYLFTILLMSMQLSSNAQEENDLCVSAPLTETAEEEEQNELGPFELEFDWMLDVQTEVINGIWYSPTIEFNLPTSCGLNFQFQTGALPTLNGYMIHKTQPSAGVSIKYRF